MSKIHVKTDDKVVVLCGKSRGVQGKVIAVSPKEGKVIVEGANKITKHVKPKKMGEAGGLIDSNGAMYASKVQLICPKCGKPTRVGHKVVDGKKLRVCKKCNETFE